MTQAQFRNVFSPHLLEIPNPNTNLTNSNFNHFIIAIVHCVAEICDYKVAGLLTSAHEPDLSGYLRKKGGKIKSYRKRWFELRGPELLYFKTKGGKKPAGIIMLNQSCAAVADSTRKSSLKVKGYGLSRVFEISAESDVERDRWIDAINKACQGNDYDIQSHEVSEPQRRTLFNKDAGDDEDVEVSVDDFHFLKVIGRGSFGKVMLVKKKEENEIYAMKILRKDMIIKENMVGHTKAEKEILQRIHHPFIVDLKYAFQTRDKLYLVLDFLAGGELFFHLKEDTKFPIDRARFYAAEIVSAIGHLHHNDIVYRDLKPENVVLDRNGHVCLTDFGLAKTCISNATHTYTFCGTPEYLAPEILKGHGHAKAVDWWSLGVLLYEMIVGLPPFYSENINEMYELILKSPLKFPPFVPVDAQQLLRGLLEREEDKRLGSGPRDSEEIREHPFFKSIDWERLENKELTPPFIPHLDDLTKYFDTEFTNERPVDSIAEVSEDTDDSFEGFSYNFEHRRKRAIEELKGNFE